MAKYKRGQIVWAKVEKTVTGGFKDRPVLILASWPFDGSTDYLACILSSSKMTDPYKLAISDTDLESGTLGSVQDGFIRPSYLTAITEVDIRKIAGVLCAVKLERVLGCLQTILG